MTCDIMPWEQFAQVIILIILVIGILVALSIPTLMYLDGYWEADRIRERWLNGDSFIAIDERHRLRKENAKNSLKRH